jgi:hypothetical protein
LNGISFGRRKDCYLMVGSDRARKLGEGVDFSKKELRKNSTSKINNNPEKNQTKI